jgi:hypothetical protein
MLSDPRSKRSLVVVAKVAQTLPTVTWSPDISGKEMFGFRPRYYNPNHPNDVPQHLHQPPTLIFLVDGVAPGIICEDHAEFFEVIALVPLTPREARIILETQGLENLLKSAAPEYTWRPLAQVA